MSQETNTNKIASTTIAGFITLMLILGICMFLPAGSLNFWQAWVYLVSRGRTADGTALAKLDAIRRAFGDFFPTATGGRMVQTWLLGRRARSSGLVWKTENGWYRFKPHF